MDIEALALDATARDDGRWFTWIQNQRVRLRSLRYQPYLDRLDELQNAPEVAGLLAAAPDTKAAADAVTDTVKQAMAEHLFVAWTFTSGGAPLECNGANALAILRDPLYAHFYAWATRVLARTEDWVVAAQQADAKN